MPARMAGDRRRPPAPPSRQPRRQSFEARLAVACFPAETRYEDPGRQYRLRAFARVKRADGCPPELVWSEYSEPFTIAPWYDSAGLPPVRIQLPLDRHDFLKRIKPNVAFSMPEDLFNQMQRDRQEVARRRRQAPRAAAPLGLDVAVQLQHPDHHDLRVHRAEHLPVAVQPHFPAGCCSSRSASRFHSRARRRGMNRGNRPCPPVPIGWPLLPLPDDERAAELSDARSERAADDPGASCARGPASS